MAVSKVLKEESAKFTQQVENKFLEMERAASIMQMATDANWQALKQAVTQNTDSFVDQAIVKFTQLELQARAQQKLAQQIIAAAKQEFGDVKRVIDGTADSLRQTVAAVLPRLSVLEDQETQFQKMEHSAAMKSLNTRADTLEAVGAGAGVIVSAPKGYLPEKSALPMIFDGRVEVEWRGWKYDFAGFLDTKNTGMHLFLEKFRRATGLALGPE